MATKNGSAVNLASGVRARLVLTATYSPTSISTSTSSVTVSWNMKIELLDPGYANDTGTYSITGDDSASGSKSWSLSGDGDTYTIVSGTDTVSLNYGSSQTWNLSGSLNNAVLPDLSVSDLALTIPARPYSTPAAPSALSVSRVSDTQQNVSWSRNATTAAPYTSQEVYRSTNGGSYTRVATVSGSATSWTDTTTIGNNKYTYRVRALNSVGTSGYSNTDTISTTPAKPSAPSAAKSGTNIVVSRPSLSPVATSWSIRIAGGATLVTGLSTSTTSYTHSNPGTSQAWSYEIFQTSSDPTLNSAWSNPSNSVQLITVPAAPSSLTVARVSDTQQTLTWTRNATTAAPYSSIEVYRSVNGGAYSRVATLSSTATSWSDTSTAANNKYAYRVRALNAEGASGYSNTDEISTTPATPAAPTATKLANGDIRITRPTLSSVAYQWQVREVGGATLATLSASTTDWTHTAPDPQVTHTYEIRAVSTDPTLYSGWSADSNTVQLLTAPAAPTGLTPNGAVRDMTSPTVMAWNHNPIDSSEQTGFQIRRRRVGGAWIVDAKVSSTSETTTWPANYYANGGANIEWEVRTWGAATTGGSDGTGASPWSATATIQPYAEPVAGVVDPDGTTPLLMPKHLFEWSFYQEQGLTQSQWELEIYDSNVRISNASGSGTTTTWQSPSIFVDGGTYSWRVRARDSKGVWSDWTAEQTFTAEFIPPHPPAVTADWVRDGYVVLQISPSNDGTVPDSISMTIQRSMNGEEWVTLAEDLPVDTEYLDWTAAVAGENCYRITALTAAGASNETYKCVQVDVPDCDRDVYIGGGLGLGMVVRFGLADAVSVTTGRQRVLNEYDGRLDPVETSGPSVPYSVNVKAKIPPPVECGDLGVSDPRMIERVFHLPGPHLYRDWTGRHMFVSLSDLQYDENYLGDVSFSVTRADGGTEAQRSAIGAYVGPYLVESPDGEYRISGGTMTEVSPGEWVWTP